MLKTLLFGFALIGAAVIAIAATAIIAVLFLFTSPANAETHPPVYLLQSVEENELETEESTDEVVEENKSVFLPEVVEVPNETVVEEKAESPLKEMTIPQLKNLAKERGIHIKSNLRKAQIIELLMSA